jgi:hypothetical protein
MGRVAVAVESAAADRRPAAFLIITNPEKGYSASVIQLIIGRKARPVTSMGWSTVSA